MKRVSCLILIGSQKIWLSTGVIVIVMLTRPYGAQQPQLLARYPLTDHKVEITPSESWIVLITQYVNRHYCFEQDFPLPRDMVFFCQPDGTTSTSRCASVYFKRWNCWRWKQDESENDLWGWGNNDDDDLQRENIFASLTGQHLHVGDGNKTVKMFMTSKIMFMTSTMIMLTS